MRNDPLFTVNSTVYGGRVSSISFVGVFETFEAAKKFADSAPAFIKVHAVQVCGSNGFEPQVLLMVRRLNEEGVKRLRAFARLVNWKYEPTTSNSASNEQVEHIVS